MYTLGTAAKATGLAKSTIHRAIKLGKISARSKDGNGYEIDPAELHRVYPPLGHGVALNPHENSSAERSATHEENGSNPDRTPVAREHELEVRLARSEAQLDALKTMLEDMRTERDRWHAQAERLSIAPPAPNIVPARNDVSRSWWPWRRSA